MAFCQIDGCGRSATVRDFCPMHYTRLRRHGDPMTARRIVPISATIAERLAITTDRSGGPDSCWPHTGVPTTRGYIWMQILNTAKGAHVWAYEDANGPVPDGLLVRHKCDNRRCCNPAHLEVGTQKDNINDMVERGRHRYRVGEQCHTARLTEAQALEIIRRRRAGETRASLAEEFGVAPGTIYGIAAGLRWAHLNRTQISLGATA